MFLAFSNRSSNGKSLLSFITGGDAVKLNDWRNNLPPNRLELGLVPTVIMAGETPAVDLETTWSTGTIFLERIEALPGTRICPPTQFIRAIDKPEYKLEHFEANGTPYLGYNQLSTPGPMLSAPITIVKLADVKDLEKVSSNKRMYPITFPGVKFPDPVPVVNARAVAAAVAAAQAAQAGTSRGRSTDGSPGSSFVSSRSASPPSSTQSRSRIRSNVMVRSPVISPGDKWTVGPPPKRKKSSNVKVEMNLSDDDSDDNADQPPTNIDETINLVSDNSQEDQQDGFPDEAKDDSKDEDYDPSQDKEKRKRGPRGPHNK